jgi:predicted glycoside hydrolase/deacetylase ChbG (UPF0249 family)
MNCTQFAPLTTDESLKPLLADNGEFKKDWTSARYSRSVRLAIYKEWCAQVQKIIEAGVRISHIDSHHHAHTEPSLFFVLKAVQQRFNIRKVRITRNIFDGGEKVPGSLLARKRVWNFMLRNYYPTATTDHFTSLSAFWNNVRGGRVFDGVVEVMVHPGHPKYVEETKLAQSDWGSHAGLRCSLVTYREIQNRTGGLIRDGIYTKLADRTGEKAKINLREQSRFPSASFKRAKADESAEVSTGRK